MFKAEYITFLITAFVIVCLIFIGIIVFFIQVKNRKRLQVQKEKLMEETFNRNLVEQKLLAQQETMEEIGKELHDNIAQQLVLISMASYNKKIENTKIATMVNDCIEEIRILSKSLTDHKIQSKSLYALLIEEKEKIESYTDFTININFDTKNISIPNTIDKIGVYRVFQEFIQNSLKHSSGNKIEITCKSNNQKISFEIFDNGKGFDGNLDKQNGIGIKNMNKRLMKFAEQIEFNNKQNLGASLSFKLK